MERGIIIIGKDKVAKIDLAQEIIKGYTSVEIVIFTAEEFKGDYDKRYHLCTKATKIIVVKHLASTKLMEQFYSILTGEIIVIKPYWDLFEIEIDKLIIICDEKLTKADFPKGSSFTRRFEIVEL
jgi:hypothetical protein